MTVPLLRRVPLDGGAEGLLVVDRLIGGRSFGGLRVIPDLDEAELRAAARTMSRKYGFVGVALGGAKAALRLSADCAGTTRAAALRALGHALRREIETEEWIPGVDMGTTLDDLRLLFEGAGVRRDLSTWRDRSAEYTAWSVASAARAGLAARGRGVAGARFVVQGYGRVGSALARILAGEGAVLVGVSTRDGAIARPGGLDGAEVERRHATAGDGWLRRWPPEDRIDPSALLLLDVDVAVPCARAWALTPDDVPRVRASVVACAANAALARSVEDALARRGVIVVPDFIANCGGIFGSVLERYVAPDAIRRLLESRLADRIPRLLAESRATGRSVGELAEARAGRWLDAVERSGGGLPPPLARRLLTRAPFVLKQPLVLAWARRRFFP